MNRARFYAIGFAALVLFDTGTQLCFKFAARHTGEFVMTSDWLAAAVQNPWIYGAIAGYIGAFITWMTLLEFAPVGPAFAASHLEVVTVLLLSVPLFGEHLSLMKIAGAACIIAGIILLSLREDAGASARHA